MKEETSPKPLRFSKCPACREGDIFKYPITNITHFANMNSNCPVCGASFEPEPGFYFGSMFITYTFNVALLISSGLLLYYFFELPEWLYLIILASLTVATMPLSFRVSRLLWLHWFGGHHYNPHR